ncbi:hypothetical protein M422DRAFT_276170 [Sphaerobolus stellatus SS14]|uniref:CCHC-type domain-containing protein n=1 Tax=Sphaerobolus stellatus (strain SS14) TaxID=990650 RepID=A0A0C9TN33_SPHS4|nr:hypothetical protein M422DRAFT_276170 [Sphaerobolus stellatus SS14]
MSENNSKNEATTAANITSGSPPAKRVKYSPGENVAEENLAQYKPIEFAVEKEELKKRRNTMRFRAFEDGGAVYVGTERYCYDCGQGGHMGGVCQIQSREQGNLTAFNQLPSYQVANIPLHLRPGTPMEFGSVKTPSTSLVESARQAQIDLSTPNKTSGKSIDFVGTQSLVGSLHRHGEC